MKLKFHKDTYYNGKLLYKAGEVYEVSEELGFANRWLKRGAEEVIVETVQKDNENAIEVEIASVSDEPPKQRGRKPRKPEAIREL